MVSCFSWFCRNTRFLQASHSACGSPASPGDQQAGPALCHVEGGGPAAPSLEQVGCPSPGSPQQAVTVISVTCAWGRLCVSSAQRLEVVSDLRAGVRQREAGDGRGGRDGRREAGSGRALGLSPLLLGRLASTRHLWSQASSSNSGDNLDTLPFIHKKSFRWTLSGICQNLHFTDSQAGVFPVGRDRALCVERGTEAETGLREKLLSSLDCLLSWKRLDPAGLCWLEGPAARLRLRSQPAVPRIRLQAQGARVSAGSVPGAGQGPGSCC